MFLSKSVFLGQLVCLFYEDVGEVGYCWMVVQVVVFVGQVECVYVCVVCGIQFLYYVGKEKDFCGWQVDGFGDLCIGGVFLFWFVGSVEVVGKQ